MINLILNLMENEALKTAFLKLANMSISASWLVLAILVLRLVLKKAPRWVNVLLWGMVAVRLICPFSIESALSLIPSTQTIPMNIEMAAKPAIDSGVEVVNSMVNPIIAGSFTPNPAASAIPLQIWIPLAAVIWFFGMVLMFLYTAISYWRLNRRIDTAVLYRDNIFQSESVTSPFVLGIIKPKIYLPFHMNEQDLQHVVAHEQAHIRRKDHWWKPLGFLLLTIHWFNPLMWLAYVLLCRDIELACDEKVIQELGNKQRADYTQALVACSVNRRMIAACPLAFGEVGVKERVKSVMNYKKPAFWIIILSVVACVGVAVCFLTNPKHDSYTLRIVVPAGSTEQVVYSDEEISPTGNTITVSSGEGLGDTEVVLKPIEVKEENAYDEPTYLTPGMPVEMDVEKGAWFKVGVNIQNPTDADIVVYVEVENVEVRISDTSYSVRKWFDYLDNHSEMNDELTLAIPEYPGVTFQYSGLQIIASKPFSDSDMTGHTILIDGMPIWNAYVTDLTGDGYPDICATYTWGSGIIDSRIVVCDYVNGTSYEISDRGQYDYYLRLNNVDGGLYVDKKLYRSNEILSSARLIFKNGCIQLDGANAEPKTILQAKLIEIHDGYFLVEPVEDSSELSSASRIEVPMKNMEPSPEPRVGDILEIEYDGQLLETYPARISNPYSIKVIEEAESWDRIPMVMVNGELYLDTGKESTVMARCGMMDGEITSEVPGNEEPSMDDQSNFGTGYNYQYGAIEGTIEIYMNGKWWIFATEEARKEIQFPSEGTDMELMIDPIVPVTVVDQRTGEMKFVNSNQSVRAIQSLISLEWWAEGNPACDYDFKITVNDESFWYHSDCGTFADISGDRDIELDETQKEAMDGLLSEANDILDRYWLTIGADGVKRIEIKTAHSSGGCEHADGSLYKKGERIWLECLDGYTDLRGVSFTALGEDGQIIWQASVPDGEGNEGFTHLRNDDWNISNIP